jgi:hypothetical protein
MLMAGTDPLLLDSFCSELIGYRVSEIEHLRIASEIGVGKLFNSDSEVIELNIENKSLSPKYDGGFGKLFTAYINEDKACSACYAALVYALRNTSTPRTRIDIGQGFIGSHGKLGCGSCTSSHDKFVAGCPPRAVDIVEFLAKEDEVVKKGSITTLGNNEIKGVKLVVFGAGQAGVEYAKNREIRKNILFYIDNDREKQSTGIKTDDAHFAVYSIEKGLSLSTADTVILISSPTYKHEMHEQLLQRGVKNRIIIV